MQDLKEYFYSHFKTEEDFNKQYGMFAPIVKAYLNYLIAIDAITVKNVDNLLKTGIELVSEFSNKKNDSANGLTIAITKRELEPSVSKIKIEILLPKGFDISKDYSNITWKEFFDEFSNLNPIDEKRKIDNRDYFIKTVIHELNHAICSRGFFYEEDGKFISDVDILKNKDLNKLFLVEFDGGLRVTASNLDGGCLYTAADKIHEAITEFLALKIFYSDEIEKILFSPKMGIKMSYFPFPFLIKMYSRIDDTLVTNTYYKKGGKEQIKFIQNIAKFYDEVLDAFDSFGLLDDGSSSDKIIETEDNLLKVLSNQMDVIIGISKNNNISFDNRKIVTNSCFHFLDPNYWVETTFDHAKLKERDHELAKKFFDKFKKFRDKKVGEFEELVEMSNTKNLKGE